MKNNIIKDTSFNFAIKAITLYKFLYESKKEFLMSKKLL